MNKGLLEQAEMLQDIQDYDSVKAVLESGAEELVPSGVVYAILDGESPIRVWREHRDLTQQQVAAVAELSVPYLSQLEAGKRKGSVKALSAIARALGVSLEDLVASRGKE